MDVEKARFNMVEQQIRPWDVFDTSVLKLFSEVKREYFVPAHQDLAFSDVEIPLGHGQSMMTPKVEARMLQGLQLTPRDHILEIGTGSGFMSYCLSRLGDSVLTLEYYQDFTHQSREKFQELAADNIECVCQDLFLALDDLETFDVIALTASLPRVDERLLSKLKSGGRMFIVVGEPPVMTAKVITCVNKDEFQTSSLFETCLTPMINYDPVKEFIL